MYVIVVVATNNWIRLKTEANRMDRNLPITIHKHDLLTILC